MTDFTRSGQPPARRRTRRRKLVAILFGAVYFVPLLLAGVAHLSKGPREHWSRADRSPAGLAPAPASAPEAVVQVYAARAYGWRGILGLHTWIALKPARAAGWERLEVVGWGVSRGRRAVRSGPGVPDSRWYGNDPWILAEARGPEAETIIPRLRAAAESYPYPDRYVVWPGPNSNTFTAYLARRVPELHIDLPATAIGKNYPIDGFLSSTPGGLGAQISLGGVVGLALGLEEGIEIDLFGLAAGIDFNRPALRLPGLGRLGMP